MSQTHPGGQQLRFGASGGGGGSSADLGFHNVVDYNADPTGGSDATQEIKDAIAAAGDHGHVWFAEGTYLLTDTISPLTGQTWEGNGCILQCTITGPAIKVGNGVNGVGDGGQADDHQEVTLRNFKFRGSVTEGVLNVDRCQHSHFEDFSCYDMDGLAKLFHFEDCWGCVFDRLSAEYCDNTTEAVFFCGINFNANSCSGWITNGGANPAAVGLLIDNGPLGNTWNAPTMQGCLFGTWVKQGSSNTFNSLYSENVSNPLRFGDADNNKTARNCVVNSPLLGRPSTSAFQAARECYIWFDDADGCIVNSPRFGGSFPSYALEVTSTTQVGGGAIVYPMITLGGEIHSCFVANPGGGYSSDATIDFSGAGGSGAQADIVLSGGKVVAVNMTANGTGYSMVDENNMATLVRYREAYRCSVNNPYNIVNLDYVQRGIYPFLHRDVSAKPSAHVNIINDTENDTGASINIRKTREPYTFAMDGFATSGQYESKTFRAVVFPEYEPDDPTHLFIPDADQIIDEFNLNNLGSAGGSASFVSVTNNRTLYYMSNVLDAGNRTNPGIWMWRTSGSQDVIDLGVIPPVTGTLSIWCFVGAGGSDRYSVGCNDATGGRCQIGIRATTGFGGAGIGDQDMTVINSGENNSTDWNHFVVTWGSGVEFFVNGQSKYTGAQVGAPSTTNNLYLLGNNNNGSLNGHASARHGEVRLYDRILTSTEVQTLYDMGR